MKKLLTLDPSQLSSGLFSGVGKAAAPLWTDGENISFRDLGVRKDKGLGLVTETEYSSNIRAFAQAYSAGAARLYVGTENEVHLLERVAGVTTPSLIYTWPTAGADLDLETWGNWLTMSNGNDPVAVWKNTGTAAPLAGTTFTWAKVLFRQSPFLLAMNTSNGPTMVEWCSDDNIELWTPAETNLAGNFVLRDLDSEIVAAVQLGSRIAIYSRATLVLGSFVGVPDVFSFRPALVGIGAVSARSVVVQGAYNYGLTQNGIFKTDGASFAYLDDPSMISWLQETVDWERASFIWGFHDDVLRQVRWSFLDRFGAWKSIAYHYDLQVFTRGGLAATAGAPREVFASPVVAEGRRPGFWQEGDLFADAPVEFFLSTKPLDFGTRELMKTLDLIRVDGSWGADVQIRVGLLDDPEGEPEWVYNQALQKNNYGIDREAQYFVVEFSGSDDFYITGIEFFGTPGGLGL